MYMSYVILGTGKKKPMYELVLVFDRFKGFTVPEIFRKLPEGVCSIKTLYNYHNRYSKADRKAREITKNW